MTQLTTKFVVSIYTVIGIVMGKAFLKLLISAVLISTLLMLFQTAFAGLL